MDLAEQSNAPCRWIVVDNAPTSSPIQLTPPLLRAGAERLEGREGAGFGAGCNQGFELLKANGWQGWIWLLNPDTRLENGNFIQRLGILLATLPERSVLGTAVETDQGNLEASGGWIKQGLSFRGKRLSEEDRKRAISNPLAVDWLSGCNLAIKPSEHKPAARFDPMLPLYYEDMDLCLRLKKTGAPILWTSALSIQHARGSGSGGSSNRRVRLSTTSYWRFLQRHTPLWVRAIRGVRLVLMGILRFPIQPSLSRARFQGWREAFRHPIS